MKYRFYILLILITTLSISCKKDKEQHTIEHTLAEFDTLTLNSVFTVFITQGNANSITIIGTKAIIDDIDLDLKNNHLKLSNHYKGKWLHPSDNKVTVYVTINKLNRIVANATCNIQSTNTLIGDELGLTAAGKLNEATLMVNCNYFYFWNNPPSGGRIKLSGRTKKMQLSNEALMEIDAQDLISDGTIVKNFSKGDCKVTTDSLTYIIAGQGNIYVYGHPVYIKNKEQSSSGKLIIQ